MTRQSGQLARGARWAAAALGLLACSGAQARGKVESSATPRLQTVTPSTILTRACVTSGPERCFNATDDNCNGIIDEGCGVETGPVQFAIAWDAPQVDVDLLVTDPAGELSEVGRPLQSGLVKQRDCPGRNAECRGMNLENVYLDGSEAPRGTYRVRVVLESLGNESPPVMVRFGARIGQKTYAMELQLERPNAVFSATFSL